MTQTVPHRCCSKLWVRHKFRYKIPNVTAWWRVFYNGGQSDTHSYCDRRCHIAIEITLPIPLVRCWTEKTLPRLADWETTGHLCVLFQELMWSCSFVHTVSSALHRHRFCSSWSSWCHLPVTSLGQSSLQHQRNNPRVFLATKVTLQYHTLMRC